MKKTNGQRLDDLEKAVHCLDKTVAGMQGELHNGLHARVKLIERMQWWQIGLMGGMFTALVIAVLTKVL